jgi:hypothetical protein
MFSDHLKDIDIKLQTYNKLNGIIKRNFGKQMTTETKLKLHNITSKPALKYGSETWVMNNTQRLEAAQMRFLRPPLGYKRLDRQRNEDIRKTLKVTNIVKEIQQYQKDWKRHLQRMDKGRLPQLALRYRPQGQRDRGRPKQHWNDQAHLEC